MNAEASDFTQFVESRESTLLHTAWLLTGKWDLAKDPGADGRCALLATAGPPDRRRTAH